MYKILCFQLIEEIDTFKLILKLSEMVCHKCYVKYDI